MRLLAVPVALCLAGLVSAPADAAVTVKLSKMHLCCGQCVNGVESTIEKIDGVTVSVDKASSSATLTADSEEAAQKGIDALAEAGFHSQTDNEKLKPKDDSGVKEGKTTRLELTGVHNCCGACNKAIKKAVTSVDGVKADTATVKQTSFVVEGDFDGLQVVRALEAAGFHVKAKK
jgi:copper chaperone CopZ